LRVDATAAVSRLSAAIADLDPGGCEEEVLHQVGEHRQDSAVPSSHCHPARTRGEKTQVAAVVPIHNAVP